MQIPTNFSAAQAVSIASVVSGRDKSTSQATAAPDATAVQSQLEKSESASADRDAQGQGDGLGHHDRKRKDDHEEAPDQSVESINASNTHSDEPPPELDLVC